MKSRDFNTRALRILERLDARLEGQTFKEGADAPHVVAIVGVFHREAGNIERTLDSGRSYRAQVLFAMFRALRRMVDTHRVLVAVQGQQRRLARMATVQHAIRQAKRGTL